MTPADLIAFEDEMAELFAAGKIKAPLHLAGGNEEQLIDIFKNIGPDDWVLGTWRSHYHCLLKGVPREEVKQAILDGRSIALCFPKYRVLCSAIVGGIAPIAVGLAWGILHGVHRFVSAEDGVTPLPATDFRAIRKMPHVWCFLGDMAWRTGIFEEAARYAGGHGLPLTVCRENNRIGGTNVPTEGTWGKGNVSYKSYGYTMTRPFVGVGKHIPL